MKTILVLILSMMSLASVPTEASEMSDSERELARDVAISILHQARRNDRNRENSNLLWEMRDKLRSVQLKVAPNHHEFNGCGPQTLAFVHPGLDANSIYLCEPSLKASIDELAQTLLHETAHLIGYKEECSASEMELFVMHLAGQPLAYENNYLEQCNLTNYGR